MKSSYYVKFHRIPRQLEFYIFRGTKGSTGYLAHDEWFTMCHMSNAGKVKQRAQVGPIRDMWKHMIGEKFKVDG